ncbi:hypothetical protein H1V43_32455 [Streptomyces sp. PSKA54]|uniref:Uncharacterized protein n=1 Tax=Streptomyces himalayensis subsp. aureolus TaxID=2758039 RepID=A0A7W2D7B0_9ACTN|nr:hypothetical protein [Streptomyces himalayensis]MBA4865976.1 hypothetical protein [Streptomyces himalayensis subsp. aureolus]
MSGQTTASEVLACVSLAIGVYGTSLIPFLLLVDAKHLTPSWLRQTPAAAPRVPHWARHGHIPPRPSTPAAHGRQGGTR